VSKLAECPACSSLAVEQTEFGAACAECGEVFDCAFGHTMPQTHTLPGPLTTWLAYTDDREPYTPPRVKVAR
jgi:hypothetical protein